MAASDVPYLAASLLLAGAGLPKLTRPEGVVQAMRDAGLPSAPAIGRMVGAGEVAVAVVALTVGGAIPAIAIACGYAGFAGFLSIALRRGGLASCGCFGVNDSAPSWWHVIVNSALAVAAIAAAATTAPTIASIADRSTSATLTIWLLAAATALLAYLLLSFPRPSVVDWDRPSPLPDGELVDVVGTRPDGTAATVRLEESDHTTLLAFLSSSCATCAGLWQRFQERGSTDFAGIDVVVVTKQPPLDDEARIAALAAPGGVDVVMSSSAWDDYDVPGSPYVMIVDGGTQRVVAERGVGSWTEIERLVSAACPST